MTTSIEILNQGDSHPFIIYKRLKVPGDDQDLFVLIGPGEKKYLLKASYYEHYNFIIGQEIICKVDKINCSGQIFLEPEHPHYKIGESYEFPIEDIISDIDPWGNLQYKVIVRDKHGLTRHCLISKPDFIMSPPEKIECEIKKIRKAEVFLSYRDNQNNGPDLLIGGFYKFRIAGHKNHNNNDYLVLADYSGFKHMLLKEYYSHFNFTLGQEIWAKVLDKLPDQTYRIEPLNPSYIIGAVYEFKVISLELISNELGEVTGIFNLEDNFGQITPVVAKGWQLNRSSYKPDKIKCRVVRYKKGKLHLENIEEIS